MTPIHILHIAHTTYISKYVNDKKINAFIALTTISSAAMFAIQTDDRRRGFIVSRGLSFYLVVVCVVTSILLCVLSLYDLIFARRSGGDPTSVPDVAGSRAITYDNPGYREGEHSEFYIENASIKNIRKLSQQIEALQ